MPSSRLRSTVQSGLPSSDQSVTTIIAVAAVYGGLTWAANSILPSLVLHAGGDVWSLGRLWMTGRPEWQLSPSPPALIRETGVDRGFLIAIASLVTLTVLTVAGYRAVRRMRLAVKA